MEKNFWPASLSHCLSSLSKRRPPASKLSTACGKIVGAPTIVAKDPWDDADPNKFRWSPCRLSWSLVRSHQVIASSIRKLNTMTKVSSLDHWDFQYQTCFNIGTAIRKTCKQVLQLESVLTPAGRSDETPVTLRHLFGRPWIKLEQVMFQWNKVWLTRGQL